MPGGAETTYAIRLALRSVLEHSVKGECVGLVDASCRPSACRAHAERMQSVRTTQAKRSTQYDFCNDLRVAGGEFAVAHTQFDQLAQTRGTRELIAVECGARLRNCIDVTALAHSVQPAGEDRSRSMKLRATGDSE